MKQRTAIIRVVIALGLAGCDPSEPCDPGYTEDHGACLRSAPTRPAGDDDGGTKVFAGDYSDFGLACAEQTDCGGAAPVCTAPSFPVCTEINCINKKELCPPAWNCLDISSWTPDPEIQSVCVNF